MITETDYLARLGGDDPYAVLHELRSRAPVYRTSAGFYLLTRYEDVRWTLEHSGTVLVGEVRGTEPHRSRRMWLSSLSMQDPPRHTRLRSLLHDGFAPMDTATLITSVLDTVEEPLRDGETVDLHSQVSVPLSTKVVSALLGVPTEEQERLAGLVAGLYPAIMPLRPGMEEALAVADDHSAELERFVLGLLADRRRAPRDDLLSRLVAHYDADPAGLTEDDLVSTVWVMWIAGVETSAGVLDQCVRALTLHPGALTDPSAFLAETLRMYASSLFSGVVRRTTREVDFGGVTVPEGADVRPSIAAAHRDPALFAEPDRFDPGRDHSRLLAYGGGIHRCPADALSSAFVADALRMITERFGGLVAAGPPVWHNLVTTRLLRALPIALR